MSKNYDVRNSSKILELENKIKEYELNDDIFLIKSDVFFEKSRQMDMLSNINGLLITINLKGTVNHISHLNGQNIKIEDKMTSINLIKLEEGVDKIEANTHLQNLNIIFKKDFLKKNLRDTSLFENMMDFFEKNETNLNLKETFTNPKSQILANEIFNSQYTGDLNRIFLQSKVLEILFNEFSELLIKDKKPKNSKVKFSSYDIDAIYKAKEIMINNIQNPPSISELAKSVTLNEFKLKVGFNNIFDTSPYKMLRIQNAKSKEPFRRRGFKCK